MNSFFNKALKKAEFYIEDGKYISSLLDNAFLKLEKYAGSLYDIQDHLFALLRMLSSWVKRDYKAISPKALIGFLAAIIYFVNPIDLISDFIPFFGLLDDITVLTYVISTFNVEIERFMDWEKTQAAN